MNPGTLLIDRSVEHRPGATSVITETIVQVLQSFPEHNVATVRELRRYCWVEGYFELGRRLPVLREDSAVIFDHCRPVFTKL